MRRVSAQFPALSAAPALGHLTLTMRVVANPPPAQRPVERTANNAFTCTDDTPRKDLVL
jgi:hypothetical protein